MDIRYSLFYMKIMFCDFYDLHHFIHLPTKNYYFSVLWQNEERQYNENTLCSMFISSVCHHAWCNPLIWSVAWSFSCILQDLTKANSEFSILSKWTKQAQLHNMSQGKCMTIYGKYMMCMWNFELGDLLTFEYFFRYQQHFCVEPNKCLGNCWPPHRKCHDKASY